MGCRLYQHVPSRTHADQWCREVQAEGCLPKPFSLDDLLACVEQVTG